MAGKFDDAGADALTKLVRSQIEQSDIDPGLKNLFLYVADNSEALLDFARKYLKQKAAGKVNPNALMIEFLRSKNRSLAEFGITAIDTEMLSDAWAVVSLVLDVKNSLKYSSGGLVGIALTAGFLINDTTAFLASFSPAQRAYYELFLQKASVRLRTPPPTLPSPSSSGGTVIRCY